MVGPGNESIRRRSPAQRSRLQSGPDQTTPPAVAAPQSAPRLKAAIAALTQLSDQITQLKLDVDGQLLWVYAENRCDDEFLERYLDLLSAGAPGPRTDPVLWFDRAWQAARHCNRAEELTDALRHLIRYRQAAWANRALAAMLEQRWKDRRSDAPLDEP